MSKQLRGGRVGTMQRLRDSLDSGKPGETQRIKADEPLLVRFLTEPNEWVEYEEYYDPEGKKYRALYEGQILDDPETRVSVRYLCEALDVTKDVVIALVIPKSLAEKLEGRYQRFGTLMDRDYELSRKGEGFNTDYDALNEGQSERKLDRYDRLDLVQILSRTFAGGAGASADEEAQDDAEAMDDDTVVYTRADLEAMSLAALREIAVELEIPTAGSAKEPLVAAILAKG